MPLALAERIRRFNQGRDSERLHRKYQRMRKSALAFLRGTCHLFYEDWPGASPLDDAPLGWVCGDLHVENFGAFKGDNRLQYFDLNDFDEAGLAPCTWDLARCATSLLVASRDLGLARPNALALGQGFLRAYADALALGKARWVERETATGMVRDLLTGLGRRKRKQLIKQRTWSSEERLRLRVDGVHALPAGRAAQARVRRLLRGASVSKSFTPLDVARRIAGIGSLGLEHYVVLVARQQGPARPRLLALKAARPSVLRTRLTARQPPWRTEAERIVAVQQRVQAVSPALLQGVGSTRASFVLRELQPTEDRLDLSRAKGRVADLEVVVATMGKLAAWGHLRSSGRQGSAVADELITFAHRRAWRGHVMQYAESYARRVERDWREFCAALDDGALA